MEPHKIQFKVTSRSHCIDSSGVLELRCEQNTKMRSMSATLYWTSEWQQTKSQLIFLEAVISLILISYKLTQSRANKKTRHKTLENGF